MQTNISPLKFITGNSDILENMPSVPALPMFSDQIIHFLSDLSQCLLSDKSNGKYVDVISYAYWIRKSSLLQTKQKHPDRNCRIGRGVAFHVAPSNVPVNFAVSMTSSLLAGNATAIRVSNKPFDQVDIICKAINQLLENKYEKLKKYLCIFRYEHNQEITEKLSSMCDIRIIWGGNQTIESIRKAPLPPRAIELAFADRHSIAVIDAEKYLESNEEKIAKGFFTDTYYTDQNACSSPRLLVWKGHKEVVQVAQKKFWSALQKIVDRDYDMKPIQAVNKYTSFCKLAMMNEGISLEASNNKLIRIHVKTLTPELMKYKDAGGYFFEYETNDLNDIIPVLSKQCQTVSVLGIAKEDIRNLVFENGVRGVDRIVPLGQTMGLEFIWDGFKMIETMTRFVYTGDYC